MDSDLAALEAIVRIALWRIDALALPVSLVRAVVAGATSRAAITSVIGLRWALLSDKLVPKPRAIAYGCRRRATLAPTRAIADGARVAKRGEGGSVTREWRRLVHGNGAACRMARGDDRGKEEHSHLVGHRPTAQSTLSGRAGWG